MHFILISNKEEELVLKLAIDMTKNWPNLTQQNITKHNNPKITKDKQ